MKKNTLMKLVALCTATILTVTGCGSTSSTNTATENTSETTVAAKDTELVEATENIETTTITVEETEISVFIAASLSGAMNEIADLYHETHPEVTILYNADSSGTLMQQIEEGAACDIFFSAATKQMNQLENDGYIVDGSRVDLLGNKVVLITGKDSDTAVTGFDNLDKAANMALADGSVPVGKYTRTILVNNGTLESTDDVSAITATEISEALNGIEINECSNVSKVKEAVKEGSNEIGTVYFSDAYSVKDDVVILAEADTSLSGDIIYPVALVTNDEATEAESKAAADFLTFLQGKECLTIFENYMFIINE